MVRCKVPQFLVVVSVFLIAVLVATIVCTTLCHSSSLLLLVASWGSFWLLSNRTLRGKTTEQTQHSELWSLLLLRHAAASYRICIAYSTVAKPPGFHKSKNGVFRQKERTKTHGCVIFKGNFSWCFLSSLASEFERRVMVIWKKSSARIYWCAPAPKFSDENRQQSATQSGSSRMRLLEDDIAAHSWWLLFSWLRDDDAPPIILLVLPACPNG